MIHFTLGSLELIERPVEKKMLSERLRGPSIECPTCARGQKAHRWPLAINNQGMSGLGAVLPLVAGFDAHQS